MQRLRILLILLLASLPATFSGQNSLKRGTYVHFETSMGLFTAQLEKELAPRTVENFIGLVQGSRDWRDPRTGEVVKAKPFYDGLIFHRVVDNFAIQTGDPLGDGTGGPGFTIPDEISPQLRHDRGGVLSMGNKGQRNTGGSQFFVTLRETPELNGVHAVFGHVVRGMDVVRKIGSVRTRGEKPVTPVILHRARIEVVE